MLKYSTEQRRKIEIFLKENSDKCFTAKEIYENICAYYEKLGLTTVYRVLDELVKLEKIVLINTSKSNFYQYNDCYEQINLHFHFTCDICKKTIHLDSKCSEQIKIMIENNLDGLISINNTNFHGKCLKCKIKEEVNI